LFKGEPRTIAFAVGLAVLIAVAASMACFTNYRNRKADEQGNQLSQLNGIPSLQRKVAELDRANNALAESVLKAQQEAATKAGVILALVRCKDGAPTFSWFERSTPQNIGLGRSQG
jgi:hypothetical protein